MANVNNALQKIRDNQVFFLASYLDHLAVDNWLMQKENRRYLNDLSIVSSKLLTSLKTKGEISSIVGKEKFFSKVNKDIYNNFPDTLEQEFVEALVGKDAADVFFMRVYPLYQADKKEASSYGGLQPIDYARLGSLLESNPGLCAIIEDITNSKVVMDLNEKLPQSIVPEELINQNKAGELPRFKVVEQIIPESLQASSSNTPVGPLQQNHRERSIGIRPSFAFAPSIEPVAPSSSSSSVHSIDYKNSNVKIEEKRFIPPAKPRFTLISGSLYSASADVLTGRLIAVKNATYGTHHSNKVPEHSTLLNVINEIVHESPMTAEEVRTDFLKILKEMTEALQENNGEVPNDRRGLLMLNLLASLKSEPISADDFTVKLVEYKDSIGIKEDEINRPGMS